MIKMYLSAHFFIYEVLIKTFLFDESICFYFKRTTSHYKCIVTEIHNHNRVMAEDKMFDVSIKKLIVIVRHPSYLLFTDKYDFSVCKIIQGLCDVSQFYAPFILYTGLFILFTSFLAKGPFKFISVSLKLKQIQL